MGKRVRDWATGSPRKPKRNARIIAARDVDKLSWPKIGRKFKISHQRAIFIYHRDKKLQAEA